MANQYYREKQLDALRKVIKDAGFKLKEFSIKEEPNQNYSIPPLVITYLARPAWKFECMYNNKYIFKITPSRHSLKPETFSPGTDSNDIEIVGKHLPTWLNIIKEENSSGIKDDDESQPEPLVDGQVHNAEWIESDFKQLDINDVELSPEAVERILKILGLWSEQVKNEISPEQYSFVQDKVEEFRQNISQPNITRNQLRGLLKEFVKVAIFDLALNPDKVTKLYSLLVQHLLPVWNSISGIIN